ncbi:MAG: arginase family protein, partial [Sphingosinicella sp.]
FANTAKMHRDAVAAGNHLVMLDDIGWLADAVTAVAARLEHCTALMVAFDIDVIDRSQCPAAPGARPGGLAATDFFAAARALAANPKVRLVDLTEFDPSLDVSDIGALVAARWLAEILTGFAKR